MKQKVQKMIREQGPYTLLAAGAVVGTIASLVVMLIITHDGGTKTTSATELCAYMKTHTKSKDLDEKVAYYKDLENLAPDDIYPRIHKIRGAYEKAQKKPGDVISIEMSVYGSAVALDNYTSAVCEE